MKKCLCRAHEERHRDDAEHVFAPLAPEFDTAADIQPVEHSLVVHGASEAAKCHGGGVSAPIVAGPGVAKIRHTASYGIGNPQRLADRAARKDLDFDPTV